MEDGAGVEGCEGYFDEGYILLVPSEKKKMMKLRFRGGEEGKLVWDERM